MIERFNVSSTMTVDELRGLGLSVSISLPAAAPELPVAPAATTTEGLISVREAARRTGLSPDSIYTRQDLPFVVRKSGFRKVLCDPAGVDRWRKAR